MNTVLKTVAFGFALAAGVAGHAASVYADTIEVKMLNKDPEDPKQLMVFEPALITADPGDTIKFVPVDKGHNVESMEDGIPAGAEAFKGKINQEFDLTVDAEGTYAIKCLPHYALGMVGLILVGDYEKNYEEVKALKQRGRAKQRFEELFAEVDAMN